MPILILLSISLLLIFIALVLLTLSIVILFVIRVPYAPTPKQMIKKIIDELNIKPGQIVYDLGCGDGRFLLAAEAKGAAAVGFELSPVVFIKAKLTKFLKKSKIKVRYRNFYKADIADADVVFCFLVDTVMAKTEVKLKKELKAGAKVVSYGFAFPDWEPDKVIIPKLEDRTSSKVFIYEIKHEATRI